MVVWCVNITSSISFNRQKQILTIHNKLDAMTKYIKWIAESERYKHIVVGLAIGLIFGITGAFVAAATAEVKDWLWNGKRGGIFGWIKGNGFDWLDFLATMIGGAVGFGFQFAFLHYIL